jgi:hypothetical protein
MARRIQRSAPLRPAPLPLVATRTFMRLQQTAARTAACLLRARVLYR